MYIVIVVELMLSTFGPVLTGTEIAYVMYICFFCVAALRP